MHNDRAAFRDGIKLLLQLQKKLERIPQRKEIKHLVKALTRNAKLTGDSREGYFEKLAASALLGKEPLYNNFKPKRRR